MPKAGAIGAANSSTRRPSPKPATSGPTHRRCAVYTRKSSEEGLEQAFNSLDAQREACEAYIKSQRHEGWVLLPTFYDDGGISGGTLDRPALQRLLRDIGAGRVDLVIVYKVDRLTRSLADFAKIVEVFDAQGASFVSVTQQFNTATSMGRLTLNMLLSFAQFEREVTGERIRDKIAASKRKGMWMGGAVPLGYDVQDRKLWINEPEAEVIRHVYRSYLALGSVRLLQQHLAEQGVRSKLRPAAPSEKMRGGRALARGALYTILRNRLYRGEVAHQGNIYPGEHDAIIDLPLWDQVQQRLADNQVAHDTGVRAANPSLLAGLVFDPQGRRLSPTHAVKRGRRYRYYVSQQLQTASRAEARDGLRIPAGDLGACLRMVPSGIISGDFWFWRRWSRCFHALAPCSLRRLCAVQTIAHSALTLVRPRRRNCRKPRACLMCPKTGSTTCLRRRYRLRQPARRIVLATRSSQARASCRLE